MKKTLIIVILLAAIASIALIQALGINVYVPDASVHATGIQINFVQRVGGSDSSKIGEYTGPGADYDIPLYIVPFKAPENGDEAYEIDDSNPNTFVVDFDVQPIDEDFNKGFKFEYTPVDGVIVDEEYCSITFLRAAEIRITIRSTDRTNVSKTLRISCR